MKTSDKLIIGLVAGISLYILAGFMEVRIKGKEFINESGEGLEIVKHDFELLAFKYLKIDDVNMKLNFTDQNSLKVEHIEGKAVPNVNHKIIGDTLVIDRFADELHRNPILELSVDTSSFKAVFAKDSKITVVDSDIGNLSIKLRRSHLMISTKDEFFDINELRISSFDSSFINIWNMNIDTLVLDLSSSKMYCPAKIDFLKVNLQDSSNLTTWNVTKVNLLRDTTSYFIIK